MSQPSWIGQTIGGRYQIQELLGQGGMSAVYKANDPNLRRIVAVKLIHAHLSNDPEFVRRFEEEAAAVASLRHPNIIQVFDFNNDGDTYYIVFEFVPGESLQARLKRMNDAQREMPVPSAIEISASIADALDYAHKRGMIHRDIKPANVMLNVQGQAILMDFGIVKMMGGDTHTATGAVMGTARYMSPEQIKGEQVDAGTDLYSLGVLLFETLGGRPPFVADSAMTLMMMHVNDPVPDVRELRPDVPLSLVSIVNKTLAKDRSQRYRSAGELAAALRSVQLEEPTAEGTVIAPAAAAIAADATILESEAPVGKTPEPVPPAQDATVLEPSSSGQAVAGAAAVGAAAKAAKPARQPPREAPAESGGPPVALIGGIAVAVLAVLCIAVVGIALGTGLIGGNRETPEGETPVAGIEASAEAGETPEFIPTEAPIEIDTPAIEEPTSTVEPTSTDEPEPTATSPPTNTPPPTPTLTPPYTPTPTEPAGLFARINSISLNGNTYVVDYSTFGYEPTLPGTHIHFFWNTVPPQNAGVGPTQETWFLYGGPNPFTGYTVNDRPSGATQMCSLVANADHTIQLNTGNCVDLPQ